MPRLTLDSVGRRPVVPSFVDKNGISTRLRAPNGADSRAPQHPDVPFLTKGRTLP
jgi:hypothetical protein